MPTCVQFDGSGVVVAVDPQPATFETCAYVLQSGAEVVASPFALDQEAAGSLAAAFAGLWALAYVLKLLRRQLWES
jgi:hypothetical protein